MKSKKLLAIALVLVAALVTFTACSSGKKDEPASYAGKGTVVDGDTIKIGVFQPTTGENGAGGYLEVLGTRYAHSLNDKVTIDGKEYKIELVEVDNQSDKTAAVTAAQSLISSGVSAVAGSYGSSVAIAAGQTFADAFVPAVACSATNPQVTLGNDFYFRVCFLDPFQGTVGASYAMEEGYKKAATIVQNGDDYSTGLVEYFTQAYTGQGGEVVSAQTYQTNESDFKAILTSIKEANPDVIYCPSSVQTAPLIMQQARALGITAPFLGTDTWDNANIITTAGKDAEGMVFTTMFDENDTTNAVAVEFVKGYKAWVNADKDNLLHNGGDDSVSAMAALGYDTYMTIYNAMKSLDGKGLEKIASGDIRDAIAAVQLDGVTGKLVFDENGDAAKDTAYIKTVENGAFKFLRTQVAK